MSSDLQDPAPAGEPSVPELLRLARESRFASAASLSKRYAQQAVALAESLGDRAALAKSTTLLARMLFDTNEEGEGLVCALRAVELSESVGDRISAAQAHEVAGRIMLSVGDADGALAAGMQALRIAEACGEPAAWMAAMCALANIYCQLTQFDEALEFAEGYCQAARQLSDQSSESAAIDTLAYVHGCMAQEAEEHGETERAARSEARAIELHQAALRLARSVGNRQCESTSLGNLAESLSNLGRHQEALELLDSWVPNPELDAHSNVLHHRETRGIVLIGMGRFEEAIELLTQCVAEAPELSQEITARRALAKLLERMGDLRGALDHQKRLFTLVSLQSSDAARRAASVAAVRLHTAQAMDRAARLQARERDLLDSNEIIFRRSEDLRRQAMEDALTGLPNRRRFEQILQAEENGLSVVMMDVDHFKQVNDHHTHLVGDEVLRTLADLLRGNCRDGDIALRFGGEEFLLLVRDTTPDGLVALAERTRCEVQHHDWQAVSRGLVVTASFGVAHSREARTGMERLALADARLLAAKVQGRNQVIGPA
jgi:diguanylate cyclase